MAEETRDEKSIADELNRLGKQVADALKAAWESEDRKRLQGEIIDGLQKFGDQVSDATKKAAESDRAKQLKSQAEKVVTDVKESNVTEEIRKGLLTGLDTLNRELGKLIERLEANKPAASEASAAEQAPGPAEPPKEG